MMCTLPSEGISGVSTSILKEVVVVVRLWSSVSFFFFFFFSAFEMWRINLYKVV